MNKPLPQATGFIYLVLSAVCTSTLSIAAKIGIQQDTSPLELLVFRFLLGAVILWAYFLAFRPNALRLDRAGLIGTMLVAIANCVSTYCYFLALSYIDASLALIVYTAAYIPAVILLLMSRGEFPNRGGGQACPS